jgi:hypothetical protein
LRVGLFPAGGAIVEDLQIGRSRVIEQITTHALGGETQFLAEDRHLGKSSVLLAMVNRALREPADGGLVLSVDLRDGISSSGKLAQDLLAQAIQQNAGLRIAALAKRGALARLRQPARVGLAKAGELFGLGDEAAVVEAISQALSPREGTTLENALRALDARGHAASARTVIAVDEAQELASWSDSNAVQACFAATIKRVESTVAFVFSGSEKHTIAALFETPEGPLHGLGIRRALPPISRDDWVTGLGDRYAQAGIAIDAKTIHKILYYSHELPLPTMLICQHTLDWLEQDRVTVATVDQAVNDARRHPSWDLPA